MTPSDSMVVAPLVTLRYADLVVRFRGAQPSLQFALRTPHLAFRISDDEVPDLDVVCREGAISELKPPEQPDEETAWASRREADGAVTLFFFGRRRGPDFSAYLAIRIQPDYAKAEAVFESDPEGLPIPIGFPLDEHLVSALVTNRGGCVLHACALEQGGRVGVFVGHSGAGKSTIAEIGENAGATVLSDDRTIVRLRDGVPYAYGSPWHGSYKRGRPDGGPISAVFLLVQDRVNRVDRLAPPVAFGELFVRIVLPSDFASETLPAVDLLKALVARCPVGALHFLPTDDGIRAAWSFIDSAAPVGAGPDARQRPSESHTPGLSIPH